MSIKATPGPEVTAHHQPRLHVAREHGPARGVEDAGLLPESIYYRQVVTVTSYRQF